MSEEYSTASTDQERTAAKRYLDLLADKTADHDTVIQRYHESSDAYTDNMVILNYGGPRATADALCKLYPSNREHVTILDIAAGTGLCAIEFRREGFKQMDGLDASIPMLEEARKKNLYNRYITHKLGHHPMDIQDDTYDTATICGMSTEIMRVLPAAAFEDIVRVVKPGGYVFNTGFQTTFIGDGADTEEFRKNTRSLEVKGKWRQVEIIEFKGFIHGMDGAVSVHQVC